MITADYSKARLEAAGYAVDEAAMPNVKITPPNGGLVTLAVTDGKVTLITQRSAQHRAIASALGAVGFDAP